MFERDLPFIRAALTRLFRPTGHFSITAFDEICGLANVIPPAGVRDRLRMLHCVDYRDMEPQVRDAVAEMVMETLNTPGFDFELWQGVEREGTERRPLAADPLVKRLVKWGRG